MKYKLISRLAKLASVTVKTKGKVNAKRQKLSRSLLMPTGGDFGGHTTLFLELRSKTELCDSPKQLEADGDFFQNRLKKTNITWLHTAHPS